MFIDWYFSHPSMISNRWKNVFELKDESSKLVIILMQSTQSICRCFLPSVKNIIQTKFKINAREVFYIKMFFSFSLWSLSKPRFVLMRENSYVL